MTDEKFQQKMREGYLILFNEYKIKLKQLGVPIKTLSDKQLIKWFNNHLDWLGENEKN